MLKYQEILENKRKEIELKELAVTKREEDVKVLEKELLTKEKNLQQKEEELLKKEEELKKLNAEYLAKDENITKFSNIYAKMQPNSVAISVNNMELDIVSRIFEKMDEKKVALILDELSKINPLRVKEIVETMTKKNEVSNASQNKN
jgi:flagellar motility protein MotE (MotC chaperone)